MFGLRHMQARSFAIITALGLVFPATAMAAPSKISPHQEELMQAAGVARANGDHAQAAELHVRIHGEFAEDERCTPEGVHIVESAIADYELALVALDAQAEGQGTDELTHVQARLSLLRPATGFLHELLGTCGVGTIDLKELQATHSTLSSLVQALEQREAELKGPPIVSPPLDPKPQPATSERTVESKRRVPTTVLLGVGVASFAGGIAMLGGGGWMYAETTRRGNALIQQYNQEVLEAAATARTPEEEDDDEVAMQRYLASVDDFRTSSRGRAAGLVVCGVLLTAAGIGLTVWALVDRRRQNAILSPQLGRGYAGLGITGEF
jgi:hypothetical protein